MLGWEFNRREGCAEVRRHSPLNFHWSPWVGRTKLMTVSNANTLFGHEESVEAADSAGPLAGVALEQGIDRVLDYSIPPRLATRLQIGQRVKVPLGKSNRPAHGYVVSIHAKTDYPRIKNIAAIEDDRVLVNARLLELARWMARYYATPLGIVLDSVIPSAVKRRTGLGYNQIVRLNQDRASIQGFLEKTKARKRRAILARLLQLEQDAGVELIRLAGEAGVSPGTVRKLAGLGLISIRAEPDLPELVRELPRGEADEKQIELNEDQRKIFAELEPRILGGGFSVNLLHGVTGSGKTEIYLQCIARCVEAGKQALVLVPEIALTPQTVRRFMARFERVAVLHSGLTATQRHRFWQQIMTGQADVVVGARSAVFAPLPKLGIIVVDEEHDASYKQDQAPRYNGRDVAVKRCADRGRAGYSRQRDAFIGNVSPLQGRIRRAQDGAISLSEPAAAGARAGDADGGTCGHAPGAAASEGNSSDLAPPGASVARDDRRETPGDHPSQSARIRELHLLPVVRERGSVQILRRDDDVPSVGRGAARTAAKPARVCIPGSCIAIIAWR